MPKATCSLTLVQLPRSPPRPPSSFPSKTAYILYMIPILLQRRPLTLAQLYRLLNLQCSPSANNLYKKAEQRSHKVPYDKRTIARCVKKLLEDGILGSWQELRVQVWDLLKQERLITFYALPHDLPPRINENNPPMSIFITTSRKHGLEGDERMLEFRSWLQDPS